MVSGLYNSYVVNYFVFYCTYYTQCTLFDVHKIGYNTESRALRKLGQQYLSNFSFSLSLVLLCSKQKKNEKKTKRKDETWIKTS